MAVEEKKLIDREKELAQTFEATKEQLGTDGNSGRPGMEKNV